MARVQRLSTRVQPSPLELRQHHRYGRFPRGRHAASMTGASGADHSQGRSITSHQSAHLPPTISTSPATRLSGVAPLAAASSQVRGADDVTGFQRGNDKDHRLHDQVKLEDKNG